MADVRWPVVSGRPVGRHGPANRWTLTAWFGATRAPTTWGPQISNTAPNTLVAKCKSRGECTPRWYVRHVRPGDVIDGKYRIEVELGEGGMGQVFAATHTTIGSTVAIKVLRLEALASAEVPKRFEREARNAGRLRSEHVVRVQDVGMLPSGQPYMVMEMLHGHDLASRLQQGALPPNQAVEYIVQACEGLAEAHALGMVHRDIKPANLFVTSRPNGAALVKVLDFGIATAATGDIDPRLTSTQSVMGSPSYMSPEQLKGARDVDARSDIWSLGVTLYELLTGNQPFVGNTLTALSLAIVTDAHAPMDGVPRELVAICDRCLEKNREDRFQNVAELSRALAPLFPGGSVAADLVAGSYSQPVPPTLLGLEASAQIQPTMAPSVPLGGMTSTTSSLASGETGTRMPSHGRKWVWLTAGLATIALGIGVGIAVGRANDNTANAAGKPPAGPPAMTVQPPAPPPPPPPEIKTVEPIEPSENKADPSPAELPPKPPRNRRSRPRRSSRRSRSSIGIVRITTW